jgi:hypothetical protein
MLQIQKSQSLAHMGVFFGGVKQGVVHFIGGSIVGSFPKASYGPLIEAIARQVSAAERSHILCGGCWASLSSITPGPCGVCST